MLIVLNFKTYEESTNNNALKLALIFEQFNENKDLIICPQTLDIKELTQNTSVNIFAQHADYQNYGSNTGHTLIESLIKSGAKGSLLNHSENRIPFEQLLKTIQKAKELNFPLIVCVQNLEEAKKVLALKPNYIAYEPPELIGSGKSVSQDQPRIVKEFTNLFKNKKTIPLIGAGISNREDILKSKELGAQGVLLASAFTKSKNPKKFIKEIKKINTLQV